MEVSFAEQNKQLMLVTLEGQLETVDMPSLADQLGASVDKGYIDFVIDLTKVIFMGSACLTIMIKLFRQVKGLGGAVKLVEPERSAIRRILYITQFDHVFSIYKTVDEALSSF